MERFLKFTPWIVGIAGVVLVGYFVRGLSSEFSKTITELKNNLNEEKEKRKVEEIIRLNEETKRAEADKEITKLKNQFTLANNRAQMFEDERRRMRENPELKESELQLQFNKYGYHPTFVSGLFAFDIGESNRLYQNIYDLQECNEYSVEVSNMRDSLYDMINAPPSADGTGGGYVAKEASYEKTILSYEKDKKSYERDEANYKEAVGDLKIEVRKQRFMKNVYKFGGIALIGAAGYVAVQN